MSGAGFSGHSKAYGVTSSEPVTFAFAVACLAQPRCFCFFCFFVDVTLEERSVLESGV